jgi:hypothetical protein
VENLLEKQQLIQAIGERISAKNDFDEFMKFHSHKLFQDRFAPVPF